MGVIAAADVAGRKRLVVEVRRCWAIVVADDPQ
jgi:hypothetical protein